jgi:tetratricopeptide (TPR) repeat protein
MSELMCAVVGDDEHAPAVRSFLGRWPAAVRMAAEKLASVPPDRRTAELLRLKTHGARGLLALAREVVAAEPPANRRLAQVMGAFDGFTVELAEELGCPGARAAVGELAARGILMRLDADEGYYAFPRLLRQFVRATLPLPDDERPDVVRRAGVWFELHGRPEGALRCAMDLGDSPWVAQLLREHGRELVERGRADRVERALAQVAAIDRDAAIHEVDAVLHEARGDHAQALELYGDAARLRGAPSPWLAHRMGFLHYFRGNLDEALAAFSSTEGAEDSAQGAVLLAWQATVWWAKGDAEQAWTLATTALTRATALGDPRALAASHTIIAMLHGHRGDRAASRAHYDLALDHAEAAADVLQIVRIHNNRSAMLLEESELDLALPEAEAAIELAQAGGLPFYLSAALTNRGEIRFHQGQYDAAVADLERADALDRVAGNASSSARIWLGHVYRHRGHPNAARGAYEKVLTVGRSTQDATLIVPALCGLAAVLADTEPERVQALIDEALSFDSGVNAVTALNAAAWVAAAQGRTKEATAFAERARVEAAARRDRLGEAEALHLLAVCDPARSADDPRLVRAAALLAEVGAPVWQARVRLEQARGLPPDVALDVVRQVARLAASLGARDLAEKAARIERELDRGATGPHVEVVTLGGFRVRRSGRAIGIADWPEDSVLLLKRLTAVPSQSWTRAALQRSMWPGSSADQADARLDRAVEQLRSSLDPDHAVGLDQFVVMRGDSISLRGVEVDVRLFLAEVSAGLAGDHHLLRKAEGRYSGDYLEEHPAEPWTAMLREEARGRYLEVARFLATAALAGGDCDAAARYSRRVLERDPYDESAHLVLVTALSAAGRTQEARSCYADYASRLDELGLEAVSWAHVPEAAAQSRPEKVSQRSALPLR